MKKPLALSVFLSLSYLVVILISMGVAGLLAWLAVERLYVSNQEANLLAQAQLVAATLGSQQPSSQVPSPYLQTANVLPGIHTRLIDPQGAAVIELDSPNPTAASTGLVLPELAQNTTGLVTPQELLSRPEIAQAQQGQAATALRRVEAAGGRRVLYAAVPVLGGDGQPTQIIYLATPLPDTQWAALPTNLRWQLVGIILSAGLLAGMAGLLLSRRLAMPLSRLADGAQAVAAGDLGHSVPGDPRIIELNSLSQSFNTMTADLRQADQLKNAFIADVTHELRTPLTVIKGTIETLQDGALDDPPVRDAFLDSMDHETERLIRLVNDLLVLARAEAGALNLQLAPVDLGELARSRCERLQPSASKRGVHLDVVEASPPTGHLACTAQGDADRLAQVLDNLLDNAIRYSPPGGVITVTVQSQDSLVSCQVSDQGPGIPPQHLPLIFERFYRADPARDRSQGGSGLGLAIVRSLVIAHGGNVSAHSQPGQGTTICFRLPITPTDA